MDKLFSKKWWECAGTRAIKTMAQTAIASIGTNTHSLRNGAFRSTNLQDTHSH